MLEKFRRVDNPLTIIAIFAGITEVVAAIALPCVTPAVQSTFVWFLITFPFALIGAFFLTLNFNARVLYAPADYRDDKHFLEALQISHRAIEVRVTEPNANVPRLEQLPPPETAPGARSPFDGITQSEINAGNAFMAAFQSAGDKLLKSGLIEDWSFGIHGDHLFLFSAGLSQRKADSPGPSESYIIRTREIADDQVQLSVVGSPIESNDPTEFAKLVARDLEAAAQRYRDNRREKA